ncbi:shikimate kinase I [Formosa agariphila KMM 3901]|uniref:Shikimate kinase n=1 Tax=Formosa agariphila (strain DSM 15362 / KCTC 12365 / LMG 23005 / KMM 3901 / M-2Alg 35-1) TaxID=1347342 RepID=T2KJI9_FORAG|nr:shikimate kinase [Formosa agariphila]CDF78598.1 shikimate kinase I [Formosa agariphila KMM 3901]
MNLILIGYMGSGKSTLGKKLAKTLNHSFIDLDDYIEEKEQLSISELFKVRGEIYFRKKEHEYLKEILEEQSDVVLALGGGTPCYANNMELIAADKSSTSIYFKAGINELVGRLKHERAKRPLLSRFNSDEELIEFIGKHLFERAAYYNQADIVLSVDKKSQFEILDELMTQLV